MITRLHSKGCSRRRGIVAIQVGVSLVVLLGCVALSVDVGYVYDLRGSMQSAVDASALSGASALQVAPAPAAKFRAIEYAEKNFVGTSGLQAKELDITIGHWYGLTNTFVADTGGIPSTPNAIRVTGLRPGIPLFFAAVLGDSDTTVGRSATAMQGAGRCLGIWGLEGISGGGDVITDSYDIRDGAYGGPNVRSNGDICSCRDIVLGGDTEIHGDAIYGDGYDLTLHGTSYEIWGRVDDQPCNLTPPPFDMVDAQLNNNNSSIPLTDDGDNPFRGPGRLLLTGNDNLTLPPGKYYFNSMRIESLATLTVTGPTEIYVAGTAFIAGGGIINKTGVPENLKVYSGGGTMTFTGTSDYYGVIIAPDSDLNFLGNATYYGMVVGQTLTFQGTTNIHVDESAVFEMTGLSSVNPMLVE